ncbi:MAG: hypothetical protein AB8G18_02670 [Gammaproteobacteria bacterium]
MTFSSRLGFVAALVFFTAGCSSLPSDAFRLSEMTLEIRQMQTRQFDDVADAQILSASVGVLQDLGYSIDELDKNLGVLSASKRADASSSNEMIGRAALDILSCAVSFLFACDNENYKKSKKEQDIRLTVVVLPEQSVDSSHDVRVTMQRIIRDREGRIAQQATVSDPVVYQKFFERLDKSVFLEKEGS